MGHLKKKFAPKEITTKTQSIESLIQIWHYDNVIQNLFENLTKSMPNRLKMVTKTRAFSQNIKMYKDSSVTK